MRALLLGWSHAEQERLAEELKALDCESMACASFDEAPARLGRDGEVDLVVLDPRPDPEGARRFCRSLQGELLFRRYLLAGCAPADAAPLDLEEVDDLLPLPLGNGEVRTRLQVALRRLRSRRTHRELIVQRRQVDEALRLRTRFEQLITRVSSRLVSLPLDEVDQGINETLAAVGEFMGCDLCSVFLFSDDGGTATYEHEWSAPGAASLLGKVGPFALDDSMRALPALARGEEIRLPGVEHLEPREWGWELEVWRSLGIRGLLALPMASTGRILGALCFHWQRPTRAWTEDEITLLRIAGEIMAAGLARREAVQALRQRVALEEMVSQMSSRFLHVHSRDLDRAIDEALGRISLFCGVDAASVMLWNEESGRLEMTHHWHGPAVAEGCPRCSLDEDADLEWWLTPLRQGEAQIIDSVEAMPEAASDLRSALLARGVHALADVPLHSEGRIVGLVGFTEMRGPRRWGDEEVLLLKMAGEAVQGALQRQRTEEALRRSERYLRTVLQSIGDAVVVTDDRGRVTALNTAAETLLARRADEARDRPFGEICPLLDPGERTPLPDLSREVLAGRSLAPDDQALLPTPGGERRVAPRATLLRDESGLQRGVVLVLRDDSERHELETHLRHAQKMEAVGNLAGGVAHDFNNMLAGILGYAELLGERFAHDATGSAYVERILGSGRRAAELTQKLLAFSRKSTRESLPVDLHQVIHEVVQILSRTIDPRVRLEPVLAADRPWVRGDANQLQNVLMNLAVNARDAMPEGGRLTLSTARLHLDADDLLRLEGDLEPGSYLEIAVSDTGTGIDPDLLPHIFEPFFTTKGVGRGTGLGLAMVYGAVRDHGGTVQVVSEKAEGTTFRLYLPQDETAAPAQETAPRGEALLPGTGTVLVVEDEEPLRDLASQVLERLGYSVLTAADGQEGVEVFAAHHPGIDLVLLDMVMPRLDGRQAFARMKEIDPGVRAILSSGYSLGMEMAELRGLGIRGFVQKPYRLSELSRVLRRVQGGSEE